MIHGSLKTIKIYFSVLTILFMGMMIPGFSQVKHHIIKGKHNKYADSILVRGDTSMPVLINKIENYSYTIDHTNFLFKDPLDLSPIYSDLDQLEKRLDGFKSRLEQKSNQMNLRSINSGAILLYEIADKLDEYKDLLSNYSSQLTQSNAQVKKIIHDSTLKMRLSDSVLVDQVQDLLIEGKALDSTQLQILGRVNLLKNHVSITLLQANDIISDMNYLSLSKKMSMWGREETPLFEAHQSVYAQTLPEVLRMTMQRSIKIISTYLSGKWKILFWSLLVFIFLFIWSITNLWKIKKLENYETLLLPVYFLKRSILAGCLFAYFTYSPFFFANPPMSYLHFIGLLRLFTLCYLLYPVLPKKSKILGLALAILWILYALDDLLLEPAFAERWILFFAGILLIIICIRLIVDSKPQFLSIKESPATKAVLFVTITFGILSVVFNIIGRLSLAKISGITAIQAIILGITLKVFFTIVIESIYLQFKAFSRSRFSNFFNFNELYSKIIRTIWILAVLVWTISLIRNLTFYDDMVKSVNDFLATQRSIGSMVFTFKSVVVFIFIIWISFVFSTIINFFFGTDALSDSKKKSKIGSMMLLIRLTIWILGFLIGVSAAGIPLDKLSLMIGALGVGIGFGLQNIVNNLVSGVILAFERPIQVGDLIEVGNKSGTVKEIGVRSSKIRSAEGADIIIPNGDLISQQLINWTMHDNTKRMDFMLSLPYPSDIEKIKSLILAQLEKNDDILHTPMPSVNIQEFEPTGVEIKIMWWIPDLTKAGSVRSKVMESIYETLNSAGVVFENPPK
ncbi:MAG TPA: mechanosensitive ion channel domain-containing protein [Puia sp.]|jgi:small-conductance mechanosensitive channel|nr:mechanosensitive ion channel domain-containing protein [Puia sp.]